jgi:hypothetical protein
MIPSRTDFAPHPQAVALVQIGIETLDLAGPVDLVIDYGAGGIDHLARGRSMHIVYGHSTVGRTLTKR